MSLGTVIAAARKEKGMSLWKLAELSSLGITQIKGIEEGGKGCHTKTAKKLFEALCIENIKVMDL